ncbi:MAG TPA: methylated-DNA--[protein]-cysteine S-methyltransferase [Methylibium sp.]|uniref:methylated-DNA--[protein]-cysteine S-methyltransferase n=1 Tax=Methylibium sp. TaxID=2067992 RepID=UPI002DB6473C|nr:methylated-DNA--[protein]-cysteine S-methyltransferase [Methylibium sp.]HEU4457858.1 methylated-DNA--[protein]-cysteine S-methyltransferase [Methylibium sp.]
MNLHITLASGPAPSLAPARGAWPLVAQGRGDTPLGPVTLAATEQGLAGLWFDRQKHHPGPLDAPVDANQRWIAQTLAELAAYWRDGRARFAVPLDPRGTPFQQAVWQALRRIEHGATASYGAIAAQLGRAGAVRAVGAAVGRNPISVIVPCHRVIGSAGALTGYAGGLERKLELLRLEGVLR